LKKFFTIKMGYSRSTPRFQHSSIPFFHFHGISRLPLEILSFQKVIEFLRRSINDEFLDQTHHIKQKTYSFLLGLST
jgi:hypothetical protein